MSHDSKFKFDIRNVLFSFEIATFWMYLAGLSASWVGATPLVQTVVFVLGAALAIFVCIRIRLFRIFFAIIVSAFWAYMIVVLVGSIAGKGVNQSAAFWVAFTVSLVLHKLVFDNKSIHIQK